jgi:hypothetical protein
MAAPTASEVRAWARDKDLQVGTRGRIPAWLRDLYNRRRKPARQYHGG